MGRRYWQDNFGWSRSLNPNSTPDVKEGVIIHTIDPGRMA